MTAVLSISGSGYLNKGSTGLQNNGNYLPSATMLHPWQHKSLAKPLCETQILQTLSSSAVYIIPSCKKVPVFKWLLAFPFPYKNMKSFQPHCHPHPISLPVLHSYFTHILWVPLQLFLSQSYPDILSPKYNINFQVYSSTQFPEAMLNLEWVTWYV